MNLLEEQIVRAVAEDRVTRGTRALARKLIDQRVALAEGKAPIPSVVLHDQVREAAELLAMARHRELVRKAKARDGYLCQLCPEGTPDAERRAKPHDPLDAHHLAGGNGKRLEDERLENLITAHRTCHDAYHLNVRAFVARVKAWCDANRYRLPHRKEYRT